jgi:hypothetical protein
MKRQKQGYWNTGAYIEKEKFSAFLSHLTKVDNPRQWGRLYLNFNWLETT